jgi:hypothetical protein
MEFLNIDQNYKSNVLDTINKIIEKNGINSNVGAVTSVSMEKKVHITGRT